MLGERLELLKAQADNAALPEFYQQNRENYGHANGLRHAVAMMTGVEFQPLITPETWGDLSAKPGSDSGADEHLI